MKRRNVETSKRRNETRKRGNAETSKPEGSLALGGGSLTLALVIAMCCFSPVAAWGQDATATAAPAAPAGGGDAAQPAAAPTRAVSASQLVRDGNRAFGMKDFQAALQAYADAKKLKPDALEVDFNRGLGHFALNQFDEARQAFERTSLSTDPTLAEGGQYGQAASDHAEALAAADPKEKMANLESAMRRYHDILSANRENPHAREANRKAAMMWRMLKEEQQKQEQQQQDQNDKNKDEQQQDQQNQGDQQKDQQKKEEQQQEQQGEQEKKQEQQQQQGEKEEKQEQQQSEAQQQEQHEAEAKEQQAEESKQQAERELRRVVDQLRDRMKRRDKRQIQAATTPVAKDW